MKPRLFYVACYHVNDLSQGHIAALRPDLEYSIFSKTLLSSVIHHHSIHLFRFISSTICEKLKDADVASDRITSVDDGEFSLHCGRFGDHHYVVVTDKEYPDSVAQRMLMKLARDHMKTGSIDLAEYFKNYQDPNVDNLYKMKQDIEETKVILHSTIEKLFERGCRLEDLVAKTETLSIETKTFFKRARKMNRWCPFWWTFDY